MKGPWTQAEVQRFPEERGVGATEEGNGDGRGTEEEKQ